MLIPTFKLVYFRFYSVLKEKKENENVAINSTLYVIRKPTKREAHLVLLSDTYLLKAHIF